MTICILVINGIFQVNMAIMLLPPLPSATIVDLWIIKLPSVLSLAMKKSARRLAKHKPRLKKLREVVDEAVVDVEVEQVMEILMGNMLLGVIIPRRVPTLESQTLMVLGKCIVPNAVGGMKHTLPSIMKSSNDLQLRSRCHHTILSG